MKKENNTMNVMAARSVTGAARLTTMLLALLLLSLWGIGTAQASTPAVEETYRYMVMLNGTDVLKLEMPVYDEDDYDAWIDKGYVYITPEGGTKETLFYFSTDDKGSSGSDAKVKCYKGVDGVMLLNRDRGYSTVNIAGHETQWNIPLVGDEEYHMIHLLWYVPDQYRGKKVTISWDIHKTGTVFETSKSIDINASTINIPAAPQPAIPTIQDPMLGYDAAHAGNMMLIYTVPTGSVEQLTAHYKDVVGNVTTLRAQDLGSEVSGFLYFPADRCFKDFYLEARYIDSEEKTRVTQSKPIDLPMLHQPVSLTASLQSDGNVLLTWNVGNAKWGDLMPDDLWEVQRCVSGVPDAADQWMTIGQVEFSQGTSTFEYTDKYLSLVYQGKTVHYRVRRAITSLWDWAQGSYASASLPGVLRLPAVTAATVGRSKWEEENHVVGLDFSLGCITGELGKDGLYRDSKGNVILRTAADWENLAKRQENNAVTFNVIMANDIDLTGTKTMMGTATYGYRGTFDGNGHTLTVNYDEMTGNNVAPFTNVVSATIKNLHVKGLVRSSGKFAAGLIGHNEGNDPTYVQNCHISTTVVSTIDGDASSGGIVGRSGSDIELTNCLFDGKLQGDKSHSMGGFIGAVGVSDQKITNCLFAPADLSTRTTDCCTFVRDVNYKATITNSYYTIPYHGRATDKQGRTILYTTEDWDALVEKVKAAGNNTDFDVVLGSDIEITKMMGTNAARFRGTFNGNGHTLVVNIDSNATFVAPFQYVQKASIKNLNVRGTVKGGIHASGLVGSCRESLDVYNCHVSTNITTTDHYAGGIVGHGGSTKNRIYYCLFDGTIAATTYDGTSYAGAFIGWEDGGTSNEVKNNLENGNYININHAGLNYAAPGTVYGGTDCYHFHDWGEGHKAAGFAAEDLVQKLGAGQWEVHGSEVWPTQLSVELGQGSECGARTPLELTKALGSDGWTLRGNLPAPLMTTSTDSIYASAFWDNGANLVLNIEKSVGGEVRYEERRELTADERKKGHAEVKLTTSCVDHAFHLLVEQGSSKLVPLNPKGIHAEKVEGDKDFSYLFDNNVRLQSLTTDTLQTAVALTWTATGVGDYYRVLRFDKMEGRTDTLVDNYNQLAFMDRTPRPQHAYVYTIEGVNDCEGQHVSSISRTAGCCPNGMVRGYVRMADGTAMAGVTVKATPKEGKFVGAATRTVQTDEAGFFEIDGLIYQGAATYEISVEMGGDMQGVEPRFASFDDYTNLVTNLIFVQRQYFLFSGQVLYEGTSVPVVGAEFERDGAIIKNGSGQPVVTDSQGNFVLSIPQGDHSIRVVKAGHVFADDGFYLDPDAAKPTQHNWQKEEAGYMFWDKTRAVLRGRVVGGDVQGDKPLGRSLSHNNLGDSLTIVMQLEGDNASYLVRDQLNGNVTELHYRQPVGPVDTCQVNVYRHRIVIHPADSTGEYLIKLPPVKYKITEVYAQVYPTLFQAGQVGQTLDLTRCEDGDTATWNRIYHATPTLAVTQFNITGETFYGIKSYTDNDNTGRQVKIELWSKDKGYSFGHPVFMAGSPVTLLLSAQEQYFWNNDVKLAAPDVVHLPGGNVRAQNGLISTTDTKAIELDSIGEAVYTFTPQNLTFTEENDMALKTLTLTLEYDNSFYDVAPLNGEALKGFVLASKAKPQGRRIVADGGTFLIDILRDPPGAGSSAYIEKGTKLSYSFSQNVKAQFGAKITVGKGNGSNMYSGIWSGKGAGDALGNVSSVSTQNITTMPLIMTYYNSWQYNYNFETTERISTSSGNTNVGRDADVFIGLTQNSILEDAIAVRAVDDTTCLRLSTHAGGTFTVQDVDFSVKQGAMKVLAEGVNSQGKKVYLIRDEVLSYYSELKNTFAHSQVHIEKELIPNLITVRNSLLLDKSIKETEAQTIANAKGHPVYISHVPMDSEYFSASGYYTQVDPEGKEGLFNDSIQALNNKIATWIGFLGVNEREKLQATDLVASYDVDGRAPVTYSENFSVSEAESRYFLIPILQGLGGLSWGDVKAPTQGTPKRTEDVDDDGSKVSVSIKTLNNEMTITAQIVTGLDYNYNYGQTQQQSKKVGFTLAPSAKSQLVVDVYRVTTTINDVNALHQQLLDAGYEEDDVNQLLFTYVAAEYIDKMKLGSDFVPFTLGAMCSYMKDTPQQFRSLVYRTRGGATAAPYEDERRTKYYNAGQILDEKTREIDRLRIWADQQSVSNVPYDEPARFTVYMANESELPEMTTPAFTYFLDDATNAKGAKVVIDGAPMAGEGHSVVITAGTPVTKQVEIWPGADFDYENVGISLYDTNDKKRKQTVYLSAHFVPTAGKVNISLPGDKWVINTESQYDTRLQQYYMPVRIDGFDVNYRGFDHIELQYKLSTQGDKEWVNVCSYYKDPQLMAKASGVCQLIEDDGNIMAQFFGEADPVEQYYDLRAVCYCRHGGGFLTRASDIISGVKDTRRPQLFGTPKPEDGILDIGDDILLRFSEPIAGNYLRPANNFQVLGQTNSNNITLSTSLHFDGGSDYATPLGSRNLAGKAFTIDVMLNPEQNGEPMTVFAHGDGSHQLELGLTADRRLSALFIIWDNAQPSTLNSQPSTGSARRYAYESSEPVPFSGLRSVRYVLQPDLKARTTTVTFYDGTRELGSATHPFIYDGFGEYLLGTGRIDGTWNTQPFRGDMLEFRLWNHALSMDEMTDYSMKHLTGYELGLLDNYPLSEGKGQYSFNRAAGGSDLRIAGPTWRVPDGLGMRLDGQKGFRLNGDKFQRWSHQDYTLMFWFRTTDASGTLLANGPAEHEAGANNHFRFYVEDGDMALRLGGMNLTTATRVNNGAWHHAALTVSRSRNTGCLYLDEHLSATFTVDTIGGILGGYLAAGATYTGPATAVDAISGHIDEIAMFEMAMPESFVKNFANITPTGEEMGLRAYLNFSHNELQTSGAQRLMPTGVSLKRYKDYATGELTAERDTIVAQDVVNLLADRTIYAPMQDTQQLENIRYSFVADGKDLLINLDVPDERIEKTNVYVLVRDVTDLNGNTMASPAVMNLYVYRNPLRWSAKRLQLAIEYGEEYTFTATIKNLSGMSRRFSLEGLPVWMTASETGGTVPALDEQTITFTVSPSINIGNFDETLCLVGEDGMNEPLPLSIIVRGKAPDWAGANDQLTGSGNIMNVVAQVEVGGIIMNDPEDRLAVFGNNHQLLGVTTMDADASQISGSGLAYLTIYNSSRQATPLTYEFFDASTGIIHRLLPDKDLMHFKSDTIVGTVKNPARLTANNSMVQTIHLKKGWNWISFNVWPDEVPVGELMNNATQWQVGDGLEIIRPDGTAAQLFYKAVYNRDDPKNPLRIWDCNADTLRLDPMLMYRAYSVSDKVAYFGGFQALGNMVVAPGWNRIGYLSALNLPLGTALADYTDHATAGDIIKSQSEFAMLTVDNLGNKAWKGTLKYMRQGEGYMLKRSAPDQVQFRYPTYYEQSRYAIKANTMHGPLYENRSATSMTVVAVADGIEVLEGDTLTAWRGAERCGVAVAGADGLFFLNIGGASPTGGVSATAAKVNSPLSTRNGVGGEALPPTSADEALHFTLDREGQLLATASNRQLRYVPNASHGTPSQPTAIRFVGANTLDTDSWYDLSGRKMANQKLPAGVYIHNNKKITIK